MREIASWNGAEVLLSELSASCRHLVTFLTTPTFWADRVAEEHSLLLTPFERNLQVWRQLWRVIERSHLIVQIVDGRNPITFRCEDLENYVSEVGIGMGNKQKRGIRKSLLLINKSDLLTKQQRCVLALEMTTDRV